MAIQTVVANFDEKIIRSAIELELDAAARSTSSTTASNHLRHRLDASGSSFPSARVVVGHGQMGEDELESVMLAFMHHEYDVLVATTIIENGLDIPLANTIIINRADRYGLQRALPTARPRRPLQSPRLCLSADPAGHGTDRHRAPASGGVQGIQ